MAPASCGIVKFEPVDTISTLPLVGTSDGKNQFVCSDIVLGSVQV